MPFYKLSDEQADDFQQRAEVGMNHHIAYDGSLFYIVIGGVVALSLDGDIETSVADYLDQDFVKPDFLMTDRVKSFEDWCDPMLLNTSISFYAPGGGGSGPFRYPPLPILPAVTLPVYGHCLFSTTTTKNAVFYRYEHFPKSRRINLASHPHRPNTVSPDTYAAPASEIQHISSGFGAVARFALPSLLPAIFRYEIQPTSGTNIKCGASVPLYGQSGGGVEVVFPVGCSNRGAIADPIYISPL